MSFRAGDRVRVETIGDDGLPLVRYGFIGGLVAPHGSGGHPQAVSVMLDGELGASVIPRCRIQVVSVTNVELRLSGSDLMTEPDLRRGLLALWHAEADSAGLDVDALHPLGDGLRDSSDSWALAEMVAGGEHYVVRAFQAPGDPDTVRVSAAHRWASAHFPAV
jgi:hypothetical protein